MKRFLRLIVLLLVLWVWAFPAQALPCRHYRGHEVCILSIKRSAKNYWEYRASVRLDGVTKPIRIYDCRSRRIVLGDPFLEELEQDDTPEVVCSYFKKPRDAFGMASGKPRSLRPFPPDLQQNDPTTLKTP